MLQNTCHYAAPFGHGGYALCFPTRSDAQCGLELAKRRCLATAQFSLAVKSLAIASDLSLLLKGRNAKEKQELAVIYSRISFHSEKFEDRLALTYFPACRGEHDPQRSRLTRSDKSFAFGLCDKVSDEIASGLIVRFRKCARR